MFDWLDSVFRGLGNLRLEDLQASDWLPLLVVLGISCTASVVLSLFYSLFFERRSTGSDIHRAVPALGTAITGVFICLQFSLPLSLGLLGALSIVRFRTPIKEPEEIGFLMLLIASAICCATLNFLLLVMILGLSFSVMVSMRYMPWCFGRRTAIASLVVTASAEEFDEVLPQLRSLVVKQSRGATLDAITECAGMCTATLSLYGGSASQLAELQKQTRKLLQKGEVSLFLQRSIAL
jgi:hypothetical protein